MTEHYDIAVIGAGPGGYVAAIRAAQLGLKAVCIEKQKSFGGTCLNVGCIPSKTLLQASEMLMHFREQGKEFGIDSTACSFDYAQLMKHKQQVVKSLVDGIQGLFRKNQVDSIQGEVEFISPHRIKAASQDGKNFEVEASNFIIATGSEPIPLPNIPFDEKQIVSSTGALSLSKVPSRLVVVGAGVIGVELASVYQRLGSEVIIIEMLDQICPAMDQTISLQLLKSLQKQGMQFFLSSRVVSAVVQPNEVILTADLNKELRNLSADVVLVAVGRRPFTKGLGLEKIGIQLTSKGYIPVDGNCRTALPNIFAVGDVIEGVMLAHRASAEGVAVVEYLKGERPVVNYQAIPNVIYTYPEVGAVGLTEKEAQEVHLDYVIGKSYFRGNARARCSGETEGLVKIIGEKKTGRCVGMHILGPHASELISEGMLAIQNKASLNDIADAPQAHPTLSEAIKEAALDALGRPMHQ